MLNKNTLENIAKYSNKLIKVASYFAQSDSKIMVDKLSIINDGSSLEDLMEAFNSDLKDTATHIYQIQALLGSVNNKVITELDNEEKDISVLFGENYNESENTLSLGGMVIRINKDGFDKKSIENKLCKSMTGISYDEFKKLAKVISKGKIIEQDQAQTDVDKIEYLSNIATVKTAREISKKIKDIVNDYRVDRRAMNIDERNLIDRKITGSRAMIDSVVQQSTYITNEGVDQLATPHKKEKDKIETIKVLVSENIKINALELDKDTDLDKVIDVLNKLDQMSLNLENSFDFKVRKLGNYKANGLYLPSENLVAIDVAAPSALIHELTHLVDINNDNIFYSQQRKDMVALGQDLLDVTALNQKYSSHKYISYLERPNEIIARLGEISYLLNEYNYTGGSVSNFMDKVKVMQQADHMKPTDILIAKSVDEYRSKSEMYFDFDNWSEENALSIKQYFMSYYRSHKLELEPIEKIKMPKVSNTSDNRVKKSSYNNKNVENILTGFNSLNIKEILNENKVSTVIDSEKLINTLMMNVAFIGREKVAVKGHAANQQIHDSWEAVKEMSAELIENEYPKTSRFAMARAIDLLTKKSDFVQGQTKELLSIKIGESWKKPEVEHFLKYQGYRVEGGLQLSKNGSRRYDDILKNARTGLVKETEEQDYQDYMFNEQYNYIKFKVGSSKEKRFDVNYEDSSLLDPERIDVISAIMLINLDKNELSKDNLAKINKWFESIENDDVKKYYRSLIKVDKKGLSNKPI